MESRSAARFRWSRSKKEITFYYRNMPHWRQEGATYFVTFRLADSLPQSKMRELDLIRQQWVGECMANSTLDVGLKRSTNCQFVRNPETDWKSVLRRISQRIPQALWEKLTEKLMQKYENILDEGLGECHLRKPKMRKIRVDTMHNFDSQQYQLGAFVIMPNHVHAIIRPLESKKFPLEKILQGRKQFSAREINLALNLSGQFWQHESFDRIIRDEEHLYRCLQYIARNPRMAHLKGQEVER